MQRLPDFDPVTCELEAPQQTGSQITVLDLQCWLSYPENPISLN